MTTAAMFPFKLRPLSKEEYRIVGNCVPYSTLDW